MRRVLLSLSILSLLILAGPVLAGLVLADPVLADLPAQELQLTSTGQAFEINPDSQGILWVSDFLAGEIWRVDPAGGAAIYSVGGSPSDARHDGAGMLWWGDYVSKEIKRLPTAGGIITTWQITGTIGGIYGTGLDEAGKLWATDTSLPNLYSLDPTNNTVCTYLLPGDMRSDYLVAAGGFIWLSDQTNGGIARLQTSTDDFTTWPLAEGSYPKGLALDSLGRLWWADYYRGEIGNLDAGTDQVITYTQSIVQFPQMISVAQGRVWFTDYTTFGMLDPSAAFGTTSQVSPQTVKLDPQCQVVAPTSSGPVAIDTVQTSWWDAVYPELVSQGGWRIFEIDPDSIAWGIAALEDIWVVNQDRQVLLRARWEVHNVYLPMVRR